VDAPVITEDYVREKLAQAVDALAIGAGPLHQRLFLAALATSTLQPRDFVDDESRAGFGAIREMLTRHEARANEGRVGATLARMSDDEARSVAKRILELDAHYRSLSFFAGKSIRNRGPVS
jgi:hypothetical protein